MKNEKPKKLLLRVKNKNPDMYTYLIFQYSNFFLAGKIFAETFHVKILVMYRKIDKKFAFKYHHPKHAFSFALCTIFTILLTFLDKSCNAHMLDASGACVIAIWSQDLLLNSGRSYATFGTKIPVF